MDEIHEQHPHGGGWLREIVFGLNDGLVTPLIFIMLVSGVASTHLLLVVLGEVLAGGISMTLGGYLSARTSKEVLEKRIATEHYEIRNDMVDSFLPCQCCSPCRKHAGGRMV